VGGRSEWTIDRWRRRVPAGTCGPTGDRSPAAILGLRAERTRSSLAPQPGAQRAGRSAVRTIVRGKNLEVPDRVREYAERKFARLERLLDDRTDAIVELSNEAHRSAADAHIVDVTLVIDGKTLKSHAAGASFQAALDVVVDKVERQAIDFKEKPRVRARPEEEKVILRKIADGTADTASERKIVKIKRFAIEPMFEEDAVAAMEDLGHDFYVFVNAETERIAVLYRRKDGDFGLIEPAVGGEYTPTKKAGSKNGRGKS
jgi:putative sigma-54 modulation protein